MSDSTAETVSPVARVVSVNNFETYFVLFCLTSGAAYRDHRCKNTIGQAGHVIFKCQLAPSTHTNLTAMNSNKKRDIINLINKYICHI